MKPLSIIFLVALLCLYSREVYSDDLPSLDDLKKSLAQNNIEVKVKHQEIKAYQSKNSILQFIRATGSYNFETQTSFYGFVVSIPINILDLRGKEIKEKELELQQLVQEKEGELEELYYTWLDYQDLLPVRKAKATEKWEQMERKKGQLKFHDTDHMSVTIATREYLQSLYEFNSLKRDIQKVESQIKRLVGIK